MEAIFEANDSKVYALTRNTNLLRIIYGCSTTLTFMIFLLPFSHLLSVSFCKNYVNLKESSGSETLRKTEAKTDETIQNIVRFHKFFIDVVYLHVNQGNCQCSVE